MAEGRRRDHQTIAAELAALRPLGDLAPLVLTAVARAGSVRTVAAGRLLVRAGDIDETVFVVLGGRLAVEPVAGGPGAHIGPGGLVGERAPLDGGERAASVRVVRDARLLRLTGDSFRALLDHHPTLLRHVTGELARRMVVRPTIAAQHARVITLVGAVGAGSGLVAAVGQHLAAALARLGSTAVVDRDRVEREVGRGAARAAPGSDLGARLGAWIARVEESHRYVLLVPESRRSAWTMRCIRQSDRLAVVARSDTPVAVDGAVLATGGRHTAIVLVHPGTTPEPGTAARWLAAVPTARWFHLPIGAPDVRDAAAGRIARHLAGRAVGVVLGGGGAKGFAHLGVLRAIEEAGIPIDAVGGTSIGSVMGGEVAMGWDHDTRVAKARTALVESRRLVGFTLPLVSLSSSRKLTRLLRDAAFCGEWAIEDLPIPFFAVAAGMLSGEEVVLDRGPLWRAVRASISLPGIMPPVYDNGDLLIDGGVLNNVPIDVMRARIDGGKVIAVSLTGSAIPDAPEPFEPTVSGWQVLASRLIPGRAPVRLPSPAVTLLRAKDLGGRATHLARLAAADIVIEPRTAGIDSLDFGAGVPLVDEGYRAAKLALDGWFTASG